MWYEVCSSYIGSGNNEIAFAQEIEKKKDFNPRCMYLYESDEKIFLRNSSC